MGLDFGTDSLRKLKLSRRNLIKGAAASAGAVAAASALGVTETKPTFAASTTPAYLKASRPDVTIVPLLTVGDYTATNGYRMVGLADGMGGFNNGDGTFTLLVNHEVRSGAGLKRAHGSNGAFVSKWIVDSKTLQVIHGEDFTRAPGSVYKWDAAGRKWVTGTQVFDRLCSADLAPVSAFQSGGLGTSDRIFLDGDEINEGRAWAHVATGQMKGTSWELPRLGKFAWENALACPHSGSKTLVFGMDDGSINTAPVAADNPCEVYLYIGDKQADGNVIERAGLNNGKLYGLKLTRGTTKIYEESNQYGLGDASTGYVARARFELVELGDEGDVSAMSGLQLSQNSIDNGAFRFQRVEDGAWDPRPSNRNDFYFVTTANMSSNSRLWRVRFDSLDLPMNGGTIEILLTATAGRMFDNICIDTLGRLFIQEDTGNDPYVSKIRMYTIATGKFQEIAQHDPELFVSGVNPAKFITQDEESSGIFDASALLGPGWFLGAVQVHKAHPDPELVEYGQLFALKLETYVT